MVGGASREVQVLTTRERDGVQQSSKEWYITFDAGFDAIVGLPALRSWGGVNFSGVRRPAAEGTTSHLAALTVSRDLTCVRLSRATRAANSSWDALPATPTHPRSFAAVTERRMMAAKRDLRERQACAAAALAADWRLRTPPFVSCLRGSRAADVCG